MASFIARLCPKCGYRMGVYIADPEVGRTIYKRIYARCAACEYKFAWALITSLPKAVTIGKF